LFIYSHSFLRKSQSLQVAEELLSKYPKLELGLDYQHALVMVSNFLKLPTIISQISNEKLT